MNTITTFFYDHQNGNYYTSIFKTPSDKTEKAPEAMPNMSKKFSSINCFLWNLKNVFQEMYTNNFICWLLYFYLFFSS